MGIVKMLVHLLVDAVVVLLAAKAMPRIEVANFKSAIKVAIIIGIIGFLISWLLTLILNFATLGIFWFFGLGFVTKTIANAIVIEIADGLIGDFKTRGFLASLILAILIALASTIVDWVLFPKPEDLETFIRLSFGLIG